MIVSTANVLLLAALLSGRICAALDADSYAVYSAVLGTRSAQSEPGPRLLVFEATLDPSELLPDLKLCEAFTNEWKLRVSEILNRKESFQTPSEIIRSDDLAVRRTVVILNAGQADEWRRRRFQPNIPFDPPGTESSDPFPESDLIRLSAVLFDPGRIHALVYVSKSCGSLCGSSSWLILERKTNLWRVIKTLDCGFVN